MLTAFLEYIFLPSLRLKYVWFPALPRVTPGVSFGGYPGRNLSSEGKDYMYILECLLAVMVGETLQIERRITCIIILLCGWEFTVAIFVV